MLLTQCIPREIQAIGLPAIQSVVEQNSPQNIFCFTANDSEEKGKAPKEALEILKLPLLPRTKNGIAATLYVFEKTMVVSYMEFVPGTRVARLSRAFQLKHILLGSFCNFALLFSLLVMIAVHWPLRPIS